jgi:hypothetical protein
MRWVGRVARVEEMIIAYRLMTGRPKANTLLGISRRKWEDTVKMDVKEMRWDTVHWIRLAKDRAKWRAFLNTRWWNFVFCKMRAIC